MFRATVCAPPTAGSFAAGLAAWSLGLFALFRLPWVAAHLLLPATRLQAAAGAALLGPSALPIEATLACSGADALSLCAGAILAYPARWRMRAAGVAAATAGLLALNTLRIGTLGRATASPRLFDALHVYIWPAVLTLAIAGFVFGWMVVADRGSQGQSSVLGRQSPVLNRQARFAITAAVGLLLFTLASPLYLESARVLAVAAFVARAAAFLLRLAGVDAVVTAAVLATPRGAFLVTQECIATPLIPIYAAAVLVYAGTWRRAALGAAAAAPLFVALGIARLLVVALPASLAGSPAFAIHAFSQCLVAVGMVCGAALWRGGPRAATWPRAAAAIGLAILGVALLGGPYTRAITWIAPPAYADPQGALQFLPAFQIGLFVALWLAAFRPSRWTRFACGLSLLAVLQIAVNAGVHLLVVRGGIAPLVRDIRGWALLGPALVMMLVTQVAPPRR